MARCRCDPETCGCNLRAGPGINLAGTGDANSPWTISAIPNCVVCDAPGVEGWVLTRNDLGQYVPMPPPGEDSCVDCVAAATPGDVLMWNSSTSLYAPTALPPGPAGPQGAQGPTGVQGPPGQSIQVKGVVTTSTALATVTSPVLSDGWIASDTGHLWIYKGPDPNNSVTKWTDVGNVTGPPGPTGPRGSLWYTGPSAPGTIAGVLVNDMYLDVVSGDVYHYT